MKTLYKIFSVLLLALMAGGFNSCEVNNPDPEKTGSLELFLSLGEEELSGLKSDFPDSNEVTRYHALLTVLGEDSVPVLEDELLPLYKFGGGFFSEKIELKVGHYHLVKFMIINPEGEVIFASPLRGSPKAYLVKNPLPIEFKVKPEATTRLSPEVLPVNGEPPSEFGYSVFGFVVVKPLPFFIAAIIDDPRIMAPYPLYTEASLKVYHPDGWQHGFDLKAQVNRLVIRGGAEYYKFLVLKKGYEPIEMEVPAEKLLATTAERPLMVRFGPGQYVLRLQPDPDKGIDAMISNLEPDKNFGKHPYFEATYMSESVMPVMRENRSLIRFSPTGLPKSAVIQKVMLTLFYDIPIPWDQTHIDTIVDAAGKIICCCGGVLQQIIEPWDEHEVTWEKQPKTTDQNQVVIRPFIKNANFIEVDVTRLFVNQFSYPSYGMLFKLFPEPCIFPGFRFASSDFKEPKMRPILTIHYTLPMTDTP